MKIEPGCLAMIHGAANPENNGKVVEVVARRGEGEQWLGGMVWTAFQGEVLWHISSDSLDLAVQFESTGHVGYVQERLILEHCLLRIDGGQFEYETEREKELVQ